MSLPTYEELISALIDARDALEDYSDVRDGDDGRQEANRAMSAVQAIDGVLERAGERRHEHA